MDFKKKKREIKSISFEHAVLEKLEWFCKKNKTSTSKFVNFLVKRAIIDERQFYRSLAKHHSAEFQKYKFLMDSAPSFAENTELLGLVKTQET